MRDLLILGIIIAALPFAIAHTWIAVILWTWISLMNPHKLAFGFILNAPIAAVAAGAALLSMVFTRDKLRMPWTPPVIVLLLLVLWMCLTTVFAIDPIGSSSQLNKVMKIQIMTVVALIASANTQTHRDVHLDHCALDWILWVKGRHLYHSHRGGVQSVGASGKLH
jgi:putative inorganic carbon (HCO3(-)) transporter